MYSNHIDIEWLQNAIKLVERVVAFDLVFPRDVLELKSLNGAPALEFTLRGVDGKTIAASKWSGVGVDGPRFILGGFTYEIPQENAEAAIGVALKNCV